MLHDGIEERLHRVGDVGQLVLGVAHLRRAINEGEIELLVGRVEAHEELEHEVQHLLRVGVVAVDLVDDHDGLGTGLECLAQHEASLGLGTFRRIHDQQHAVDHVHDTLDLAAEVGVSRSIHNVDVVVLVLEGGVLGANRDALFLFQVHGIHQALHLGLSLVGAEGSGLLEKAVDERGLAVVDVGDDRDISDVLHNGRFPPIGPCRMASGWKTSSCRKGSNPVGRVTIL